MEKEKERGWIKGLDKEYKWVAKPAKKENKRGRAKGGLLVGISKGVDMGIIEEESYGLVLKEIKIEKEKKINRIIVYNNGKIKEVLEKLRGIVEELGGRGKTTILY